MCVRIDDCCKDVVYIMDKEKTGIFIKEQREKCGLTQDELADKLNTSRENISKWERGMAIPNTEYLKALCEILNCNVVDLLAAGERDRNADKVIYNLIDRHFIFARKVCCAIATIVFFGILCFLLYYFFENYNSIKLYSITGEKDSYKVLNSLFIVNKDKCFFTFGGFIAPEDETIKEITIYYDDINNEDNIIYNSDKIPTLITFSVKDLDMEKIENDLKIQLITNSNIISFNLELEIIYKNNHLLNEDANYKAELHNELGENLPSFIDDNFTYDYKTDSYIYTYTEDETEVEIKYDYSTKHVYILERQKNSEINLSNAQHGFIFFVNEVGDECIYDINKKVCSNGDDKNYDTQLVESYLDKYKRYLI